MALPLNTVTLGEGPPVLVLHGLFGSAGNWMSVARRLAARHRVILADLRNHGASPHHPRMDYPAMADDVAALIGREGGPMPVVGHSMGGKAAMALALARPELVSRLVVVDIAPVAYPRGFAGFAEAMAALRLTPGLRRAEADAALAAAVPEPGVRGFLLQNLRLGEGVPSWRCNLPVIIAAQAEIAGFPDQPPGTTWDGPALFIAGETSRYIDEAGRAAALSLFPAAAFVVVPGAGHWVHAEAPAATLAVLEPFLAG